MIRVVILALAICAVSQFAAATNCPGIFLEHESDTKFFFTPDGQTYVRSFRIVDSSCNGWTGLTPTLRFYDWTNGGPRTGHFCGENGIWSPTFTATEDGNGWYTFEFELGAGIDMGQPTTQFTMQVTANGGLYHDFTIYESSTDLTGDLVVNLGDVSYFSQAFYTTHDMRADLNHDGAIDLADISILSAHMGAVCP
ncbi:MAG: hypothetical protein R3D98_12010 [Candidatus Krumholzibacteriia bacterium]